MRPIFSALLLSTGLGLMAQAAYADLPAEATLYKTPHCGCCSGYGAYLEERGVEVSVVETEALGETRARLGVPEALASCHTLEMGGYVVEGHMPGAALDRLFETRPAVAGIALPGMPAGTPGMPGERPAALEIHSFGDEGSETFMTLGAEG